jgi:hypothetical protein
MSRLVHDELSLEAKKVEVAEPMQVPRRAGSQLRSTWIAGKLLDE